MWVLTREHNEYDQYGEYFIAVFINKPNKEQLQKLFSKGKLKVDIDYILNGGGRTEKMENIWYNLVEMGEGELVAQDDDNYFI